MLMLRVPLCFHSGLDTALVSSPSTTEQRVKVNISILPTSASQCDSYSPLAKDGVYKRINVKAKAHRVI